MSILRKIRQEYPQLRNAVWHPVLPPPIAMLELGILVTLIFLVDWFKPELGFLSLEPSPFWLPVLLLTLQYGTIAGLVASGAATLAYVLNGFPEQGIGENLFSYFLKIWALPMLWIGVSLVLGQFRLRQIEVKRTLQRDLAQKTLEANDLTDYARNLETRCRDLERAISTGKVAPTLATLNSLVTLAHPPADLGAVLNGLTESALPGAQLSIFSVTPAGCEAIAVSGWSDDATWSRSIKIGHPLYRAIVGERRVVSVLRAADEAALAGEGLAACPIVAHDSGRVIGFVKLENTDPALFSESTTGQLALIAYLAGPALAEPRIVVDNSPRSQSGRAPLASGWARQSWSGLGERHLAPNDFQKDLMGNEMAGSDRSSRPKRLN